MIDWHHPRIYERFRCFGLCLFTLGVAAHNVDNRPAALAAIVVTMLLLVRLKIELGIKHDEEQDSLERKVHRIQQINTMASVSMFVGLMALVRQVANGEITSHFLNWSTEVGTNTIAAMRQRSDNIVIQ
jgi:hypothetical protein